MPYTDATGQPVDPHAVPVPEPTSARQAVAMTRDDHNWVEAKPDLHSTDGIKKNITALWAAIERLAAYVDGDSQDPAIPQTEADRQANGQSTDQATV